MTVRTEKVERAIGTLQKELRGFMAETNVQFGRLARDLADTVADLHTVHFLTKQIPTKYAHT